VCRNAAPAHGSCVPWCGSGDPVLDSPGPTPGTPGGRRVVPCRAPVHGRPRTCGDRLHRAEVPLGLQQPESGVVDRVRAVACPHVQTTLPGRPAVRPEQARDQLNGGLDALRHNEVREITVDQQIPTGPDCDVHEAGFVGRPAEQGRRVVLQRREFQRTAAGLGLAED
jgi:hypothetical protein